MDRKVMREQAKREYKKYVKMLPKHQHITFAKFFEVFRKTKGAKVQNSELIDKAADVPADDLALLAEITG